jgi:hypothetical protein
MALFGRVVFGEVQFAAQEEHLEFQYKFLCIVILAGALLTGLLVAGSHAAMNPIAPAHVRSMQIFTLASVGCWLLLRGRKGWFLPLAWGYEGLCMLEYVSALYYVPADEFRAVWFLTNIPGVYLLLGRRAGLVVTAATALGWRWATGCCWRPTRPMRWLPWCPAWCIWGCSFMCMRIGRCRTLCACRRPTSACTTWPCMIR